ncbi:hypothetical protein [Alteromonas pelagimontana]|nr:hypothetical protein [Alteromonas pelagimontana]
MHNRFLNPPRQAKSGTARSNGLTIMGFMLFLTGVILFTIGLIDILIRIDSLRTAMYLLLGLGCYKVGHMMMRHCATLRVRPERRRHVVP